MRHTCTEKTKTFYKAHAKRRYSFNTLEWCSLGTVKMDVECDDEMELTKLERDIARTSDDNMP